MRATKYFRNSADMAVFSQSFSNEHKDNWFIRTTLRCDHIINENRKAIVLVVNETIVQRLITCRTCNIHGNSVEFHQDKESNVQPNTANKDGIHNI